MKRWALLIPLLLLLGISFSLYRLNLSASHSIKTLSIYDINQVLIRDQSSKEKKYQARLADKDSELDESEITTRSNLAQSLESMSLLSGTEKQVLIQYSDLKKIYDYAESCNHLPLLKSDHFQKTLKFHQWACSERKMPLPESFFSSLPKVHPSGASFALKAFQSEMSEYQNLKWIHNHLNDFLVLEWHLLPLEVFNDSQKKILNWKRSALLELSNHSRFINNADEVWMLTGSEKYQKLSWTAFKELFRKRNITVENESNAASCSIHIGNLCFNKDFETSVKKYRNWIAVLWVLLILVSAAAIYFYLREFKNRKSLQDQQSFALRMLTHELRTPVTNLVLTSDSFRKDFDKLSDSHQESALQLFGEIEKLRTLAESTTRFALTAPGSLFRTGPIKIEHFGEWVQDLIQNEFSNVKVSLIGMDFAVLIDPVWIKLILRNLILNAIHHGAEPVEVTIVPFRGHFEIEVKDEGQWKGDQLRDAWDPKFQNLKSKGLGLGLKLVLQTTEQLGGSLFFLKNPTRFKVVLPYVGPQV